jgi:cytoskeletal protein CcmA (bactofilin family)
MLFKRSKNTNDNFEAPGISGPSIISRDMVIEGNLTSSGEIHIDGTVHGSVRARSCVVDANGIVHGDIAADEVFVRGQVFGPIHGQHVHLYAGAHVEGDVVNESISIDNGAYIYGSLRRAEEPASNGHSQFGDQAAHSLPSLDFGQDQAFRPAEDAFRPIKVVRPR